MKIKRIKIIINNLKPYIDNSENIFIDYLKMPTIAENMIKYTYLSKINCAEGKNIM